MEESTPQPMALFIRVSPLLVLCHTLSGQHLFHDSEIAQHKTRSDRNPTNISDPAPGISIKRLTVATRSRSAEHHRRVATKFRSHRRHDNQSLDIKIYKMTHCDSSLSPYRRDWFAAVRVSVRNRCLCWQVQESQDRQDHQ